MRDRVLALTLLLAATSLGLSERSEAVTLSSVGDAFTVSFAGNVNGTNTPGLTSQASVLVTSFQARSISLSITLTNTTDATLFSGSRVSAIGFDPSVPLAGASSSGLFANAVTGNAFPNGFGPVGVCAIQNRNNCKGGANGGVGLGQSGTMLLTLDFAAPVASVDLSNFGVRYQGVDSTRLGLSGASGTGRPGGGPVPGIPEPGAGLVFALGMTLAGAALRSRRARA